MTVLSKMRKGLGGAALTAALVLGTMMATSTTSQAQHRSDHPHPERDYYGYRGGDIYQVAYENGYHDGVEHGMEHRSQGHRYDYGETRHYKDAIDGYNSSMGDKDTYKRAYREGFRRGYDEGYRGYAGHDPYYRGYPDYRSGSDPYYRQDPYYRNDPYYRDDRGYGGYGDDVYGIAFNNGYRDGVDHGAEHAREGHRYDYGETRHYKDADSGYRSSYGSKDAYKRAYREGFRRGYDVGYRRYGGYDRSSRSRFPFPLPF